MNRPKITSLDIKKPERRTTEEHGQSFSTFMNDKAKAKAQLSNAFRVLESKQAIFDVLQEALFHHGFTLNDLDNLHQRLHGRIEHEKIKKAERTKKTQENLKIQQSPWYQIASLSVHKRLNLSKFSSEKLKTVYNRYRKNDLPLPLKGHEKTILRALIKNIEAELVMRHLDEPEEDARTVLSKTLHLFRGNQGRK